MKAYPIFPWQDDRYNKGVIINQRMCHIMKKIYLALGLVSILLLAACSPQPLQTFGTDKYYVKVNQDGDVDEHGRFHYVMDGADKDGEIKSLEFSANKNLKHDHFLMIYFKDDEVITYEEVSEEDIPEEALNAIHS